VAWGAERLSVETPVEVLLLRFRDDESALSASMLPEGQSADIILVDW
jgi:hypothetical protein